MSPEQKREILAALRSGKYRQGQSRLATIRSLGDVDDVLGDADDVRYCCLGVICEIARKHGVVVRRRLRQRLNVFEYLSSEEDRSHTSLPGAVADWLSIEANPEVSIDAEKRRKYGVNSDDLTMTISLMNDFGASFEEIADLIEDQL